MKNIKKNDIILLCTVILIGIICLLVIAFIFLNKGEYVVVRVDKKEYAKLPLNENTELLIKSEHGENLLIIKDSKAYVQSASCPSKICVQTGELSEITPIICKHNHVTITLE